MKLFHKLFFIVFFSLCSLAAAGENPISHEQKTASYKDIQLLGNALSVLQFLSMDNKDSKVFVYSALEAMAGALDRYSFFVPPDLIGIFSESLKDRYIGIGIHIAKNGNGTIEVISTEPDGPAYKAGIKPHDIIISVDGKPVNKMPLVDSLKLIAGPGFSAGSTLVLAVLRDGSLQPIDFLLTRGFIRAQTVDWKISAKNYGYIKLSRFGKGTILDFMQALKDMESREGVLKGLIIDLRNNPGGDMDSCIELLRLFLGSGNITSLDSNYPQYKVTFKANKEQVYSWPLVIIVDEGSASASELFSGALQLHKRATIIGRKTFGKGSFQSIVPLSEGGGLYVTLGKFYLPDGKSIEGIGVAPDIFLDKDTDNNIVIQKALEILKSYDMKMVSHE
jgi:carboxyl-terminal processing protease